MVGHNAPRRFRIAGDSLDKNPEPLIEPSPLWEVHQGFFAFTFLLLQILSVPTDISGVVWRSAPHVARIDQFTHGCPV